MGTVLTSYGLLWGPFNVVWKGQPFIMTDDRQLALAGLRSEKTMTYLLFTYCAPNIVSESLRSDGHIAYLPLLDFIPPFHEMLDYVENAWTNDGHMRLMHLC